MAIKKGRTHIENVDFPASMSVNNDAIWVEVGFPTGRDSATFWDSGTAKTFLSRDKGTTGQKFLYCPGTKGQRDKLKILPRDGTGRDSQNLGRDGPGQPKSGTGRGTKRDRAEKDVLKQYKDVLKQKRMF